MFKSCPSLLKYKLAGYQPSPKVQASWKGPGGTFVFLTGREEIEQCLELFTEMIPVLTGLTPVNNLLLGNTRPIPLGLRAGLFSFHLVSLSNITLS